MKEGIHSIFSAVNDFFSLFAVCVRLGWEADLLSIKNISIYLRYKVLMQFSV